MTATYGTLTYEQRVFYEMTMLERAIPPFTYLAVAQNGISPPTTLPEHSGATIDWRLLAALPVVTGSLTEGVTPDANDIDISHSTAVVAEYGAYVKYSKKLASMGIDRVAAEAADALGEQSGDSLDQLCRDVIVAGSTVQFASTATQRSEVSTAMKLTAAEVLEALMTLKNNKARPVADGKYYGIISPYTEYDLLQDTTFVAMIQYVKERTDQNPWITAYIGDAFGVRWFVTPNAKYWPNSGTTSTVDVFGTMIIGKGAFGIGGLAGYMPTEMAKLNTNSSENNQTGQHVRPVRMIQKDFGSAGTADPIDQRASIAWYTTFVTARLREVFMVRIEHATALGIFA